MATLTELLGLKKSPLEQKRIQKKLSDLKRLNIVGQTDPRFITVDPSIKIADEKSQKSLVPDISALQIPAANVPTLDKIIAQGIDSALVPGITKERAKGKTSTACYIACCIATACLLLTSACSITYLLTSVRKWR